MISIATLSLAALAQLPNAKSAPASTAQLTDGQAKHQTMERFPAPLVVSTVNLQCVPYARRRSTVSIRGNAWTWWHAAIGRYGRSRKPKVGAVLVLRRTNRLKYGHVAVVTQTSNSREILVDHANWLREGRIHKSVRVRDVSIRNDWSSVRFWYIPGNTLGRRTYSAYGFIHPHLPPMLRFKKSRMRGHEVRKLQKALVAQGFNLAIDGIFGLKTRSALIAYQNKNALIEDGIAGPATRQRLGM